jgi:hypothetical protein
MMALIAVLNFSGFAIASSRNLQRRYLATSDQRCQRVGG